MTTASSDGPLHDRLTIVDGVCPLMQTPSAWDAYIAGGADIVAPTVANAEGVEQTMVLLGRWFRWLEEDRERLMHVASTAQLREAALSDRLGIVFHFQDTAPLGGDVSMLEVYRRLGVMMIQLTYNRRNAVGDGSTEPENAGLSSYGHDVVREMNRLGIIVDLSHTGYRTTMDAIEASRSPVVFSHSNALALHTNPRNIADDQARAAAATGGLVGVNAFPAFLTDAPRATVAHVVDHIEHWLGLIGPEHVAIGLDYYDGGTPEVYAEMIRSGLWTTDTYPLPPHPFPEGIEDPSRLGNLTAEMERRGFDERTIANIMGANWMRLFENVWSDPDAW